MLPCVHSKYSVGMLTSVHGDRSVCVLTCGKCERSVVPDLFEHIAKLLQEDTDPMIFN